MGRLSGVVLKLINLWVDDLRNPYDYDQLPFDEWTWVDSAYEAIDILKEGQVRVLFLDHDLGGYSPDTLVIVDWLAENEYYWPEFIYIHSANPVGVANLLRTIDRYGPYTQVTKDGRGRFVNRFRVEG